MVVEWLVGGGGWLVVMVLFVVDENSEKMNKQVAVAAGDFGTQFVYNHLVFSFASE